MLKITIPGEEHFDYGKNEFFYPESVTLELEHSLVSLSKWESIYEKPFLSRETRTEEEMLGYIKCMIVNDEVSEETLLGMTQENIEAINNYINAKMSATTFSDLPNSGGTREVITAELIYYWMSVANIPIEAKHWHLNQLFNMIKIHNIKNGKPKKMSKQASARQAREVMAQRRAQLGTSG